MTLTSRLPGNLNLLFADADVLLFHVGRWALLPNSHADTHTCLWFADVDAHVLPVCRYMNRLSAMPRAPSPNCRCREPLSKMLEEGDDKVRTRWVLDPLGVHLAVRRLRGRGGEVSGTDERTTSAQGVGMFPVPPDSAFTLCLFCQSRCLSVRTSSRDETVIVGRGCQH